MNILKTTFICLTLALAIQVLGQNDTTIGPYNTVFTPYKRGSIWKGQQKDTLMISKILGYGKNVSIFTPQKFGELNEKYALIIMFDRQGQAITDYILHSAQVLMEFGQVPKSVLVSIESGRENDQRRREAKWDDGKGTFGEKTDEFVFDELIPFLECNYSIDRNQIIIYGHSWFGYHTTMLLVNRIPQLLGIISASPNSIVSEGRVDQVINSVKREAPLLDHRFFYRVASGHSIGDNIEVYDKVTQGIGKLPLPSNFDFKPLRFIGAVHPVVPLLLFERALYEIYEPWSELAFSYADPKKNPTLDNAHLYDSLQAISDKIYGVHIPINDVHMDWRTEYYRYFTDEKVVNMGRIATWKFMISKYGERVDWCYNITDSALRLRDVETATIYLNKAKALAEKNLKWSERIKELEKTLNTFKYEINHPQ